MAKGITIKHFRKAGAFTNGELAAGELGLDVSNSVWYFSSNGTTVANIPSSVGGGGDMLKSLYDTNADGKVNSADSADAVAWTGVTGKPAFGTAANLDTGTASGTIPVIGAGNVLPTSVIPALAITSTQTAVSQAAQLALTAQEGDVVIRTDTGKTYIHNGGTAGTMADYTELPAVGVITSVNGQTGVIVLAKADIGLSNVQNADQTNASNLTSGSVPTAQMQANVSAALNASTTATINNAALILDGGSV